MNLNLSTKEFFKQLNINLFEIKQGLFVMNDESFAQSGIDIEKSKYEGFLLYNFETKDIPQYFANPQQPKRAEIAKLTRDYNRKSFGNPVLIFLKYDGKFSLALSERVEYKQTWRAGEKVGKVIILRDVNIENPHAGHLRILNDLKNIETTKNDTIFGTKTNFTELHAKWLKVFNIKTLNEDFYRRLVKWYELCFNDIKIDLNAASKILNKKIDDELKPQAVIRVIIRLMFIWFMKEKNLIENRFFTREFAADFLKNKDTYYNAVLQNMFFGVLNSKISDRDFRKNDAKNKYDTEKNDYGMFQFFRYENFFKQGKAVEFLQLTAKIPFVNGGLFTCHDEKFTNNKEKNYIIDGFSDDPKNRATISDNVIFQLIDLFNDYVFTIEEATPMEQDIALDPELLGTIFENLIGFYNPETKENARKQTGSFYTPREIVDYMCAESLKECLKTRFPDLSTQIDDLIDRNEDFLNFPQKNNIIAAITDLKIIDPACGSGAFPMGMFNLMVRTVEKLREHKETYKNKLQIIQNCIYGVDIQNIAVEISKLRFFISLLVDYQTPEKIEDFDVLPNLETKFVVANTLIGIEKKKGGDQSTFFDLDKEFHALTEIFLPFTTAKTPPEKKKIKDDFERKKAEIVNNEHFEFGADIKQKILAWNPFNVCYCSPFFDSGIMFGMTEKNGQFPYANGFDIVIGNPPYISAVTMARNNETKNYFKQKFPLAKGSYDVYILFLLKTMELLTPKGVYSFIIPNKFLISDYAKNTKTELIKNNGLKYSVDVSIFNVFKEIGVYPIVILGNRINDENFQELLLEKYENLANKIFISPRHLKEHRTFRDFEIKINSGATGFQAQQLKQIVSEENNNDKIPFIVSGNVDRYFWSNEKVRYMGNNYNIAFIENDANIVANSKWNFWIKPKIVIAGMTKIIEAVYCENPIGLGVGIYGIYDFGNFDPYCLTAILNSKYLTYYFQQKFKDKHLAGGYLAINKSTIEEFPLIDIPKEKQKEMSVISKQIHEFKQQHLNTDALEKEIDKLVYELYGLTEEEIKIVEN